MIRTPTGWYRGEGGDLGSRGAAARLTKEGKDLRRNHQLLGLE
jgi:hypothetical protein